MIMKKILVFLAALIPVLLVGYKGGYFAGVIAATIMVCYSLPKYDKQGRWYAFGHTMAGNALMVVIFAIALLLIDRMKGSVVEEMRFFWLTAGYAAATVAFAMFFACTMMLIMDRVITGQFSILLGKVVVVSILIMVASGYKVLKSR